MLGAVPNTILRRRLPLAGMAALLCASPAPAQDAAGVDVRGEVFVGSEVERYLRVLQVTGAVDPYPWSVRGFSPGEASRLAPAEEGHPWAGRYRLAADTAAGFRLRTVRPSAQLLYNSAFPYGANDGPLWAGRGLTTAVEAGLAAEWGPLSLTLAPVAFVAQNAEFELLAHGDSTLSPYGDAAFPQFIDRPQRFGDGRYAVVDPGQSTLRADVRGLSAGVSTANQHWGPATDHPPLLGNNAAGFPHAFLGTARPANLWVGRLHGRVVWGTLTQSAWAGPTEHPRRFMSGAVATFVPRGVPGLEIGGARFFHATWTPGGPGVRGFLKPFDGLLKSRLSGNLIGDTSDPENQLASLFFRWTVPASGVEVWGELAREDHSYDLRDVLLQPEHYSAYLVGARKVWTSAEGRLTSLRAELVDGRVTHLVEVRQQSPFYVHTDVRQGHTHRGQVLGSPVVYGGMGSTVTLDRYDRAGRWSVHWARSLQDAFGYQASLAQSGLGVTALQALGIERLHFVRGFEVGSRVVAAYEVNRHFSGSDAFNLNLGLQVRRGL